MRVNFTTFAMSRLNELRSGRLSGFLGVKFISSQVSEQNLSTSFGAAEHVDVFLRRGGGVSVGFWRVRLVATE